MYGIWYLILLFTFILSNIPRESINYKPVWGLLLIIAGSYGVLGGILILLKRVKAGTFWGYSGIANLLLGLGAFSGAIANLFLKTITPFAGWILSIFSLCFVIGLIIDYRAKQAFH